MAPMLLFFMVYTMMWSFENQLMRVELDEKDYPNVSVDFKNFISSFRNSIGNTSPPSYPFWIRLLENEQNDGYATIIGP